ncbi:MAG: hypothetical protein AAGE84_10050 [Cyanobacteria bacterium P01_G01_bin.39]
MLSVIVKNNRIAFGDGFSLDFQRTLRIPDDGKTYPLPPGLGTFPVCRVEDYRDAVPASWLEHGGVFIPMYQREALWIRFNGHHHKPNAVKIAIGKINAVSGKPWQQKLLKHEADYLVVPPQPWLDGINTGKGYIKQFVAMPLGMGYTVEGQITGKEEFGGIQIIVCEPKLGKFPEQSYYESDCEIGICESFSMPMAASAAPIRSASKRNRRRSRSAEMGIAAGGKMKQKIYPDPHGVDTWDENDYGRVYVHIVNSMMYREITGLEPPATPVTAKTYAKHNLPWFDVYDEAMSDIAPSPELSQVKSIKEMDAEKGFTAQQDDDYVDLSHSEKIQYFIDNPNQVSDGDW